ncbi:MAG: hypothetical protein Kow00108_11400 [Calditrichia bacterium]
MTDIHNRGVEDILIACVDGIKGFSEALTSIFPETQIQLCIIHQIRTSLRYIAFKDSREFMHDLKKVYKAQLLDEAEKEFVNLAQKWETKYPHVIKSWKTNWSELTAYFEYTKEIRKLIYTTNTVEGLHRQFRKVTKNRTIFPNDKALIKMLFLAYQDIEKKWINPCHGWPKILNQLAIKFGDRLRLKG